ncbi:FAD-dependent monooxygenase [Actinomycetospora cinnamomea]|uniref:2-polyprenyl-6-methoxyphenol hydroxylase-like FAD-dependent oxidoreductase n=1 Tax=Actinomycetospora cinnamomea TaxID=663609 RepID=A0A2U1E8C3_9PSEU|nr:FAD-dependent monooxygenase [Actinomycetospora cinnamomea]PVY96193.1 2-polyprenyl-6-methoxyphenol hydroxylase-like FAD-dependent oxidoreductase [Actinomycetospora cinnamomea]
MGRAVVVGAGLGGLASAIALRRAGWEVTVLERRDPPAAAGAGMALWPNALRALDALGVGAAARDAGTVEIGGGIRTASGRWLAHVDAADLRRRQGDAVVVLPRPDLYALLLAAGPPVRAGAGVTRVEPGDAATTAVVHDDAGGRHPAELVVAADGLRSAVREALRPESTVRDTGQTAFRLVADHALDAGGESWGRGEYVGLGPLPGGRTYAYAVAPSAEVPAGDPLPWLRARFAGWHDPIPAVLDAVVGPVLVHPLADLTPPRSWHHGRVALLGDAAHAMTPNLGQGAAQAFLDAVALAAEATTDPASLAAYEARRRPAAEAVARRSRTAGAVAAWRSPLAVAVRNGLTAALPAGAASAALDHLLGTPLTEETAA